MEGNETRDSKQCKCHVGGGPGGWGGGLVTNVKDDFRAGQKKVRIINSKKPKKRGEEEIHSVCDGWYRLKI